MSQYLSQLNKFRSWNPFAQQYVMAKAERIGLMIWKKRTYLMPPLESCMTKV